MLRGIAMQDTAEQIGLGNKPSNIIVDGRGNRPIQLANFSVRVLFVDKKSLMEALNHVWRVLPFAGVSNTGFTRTQYQVWGSHKRGVPPQFLADSPSGVNTAQFTSDTVLIVAGPFVPWSRRYRFWARRGVVLKDRVTKDKRFRGLARKERPRVPLDIYETVARRVRRKYPWLVIKDWWIKTENLTPGFPTAVDRIGGVAILLDKRGRI